jgi:DNA segregation ATPase FtsK/SpoIIIE, S-DNA-T family
VIPNASTATSGSRGSKDNAEDEEWLRQVEGRCKGALQQFQLQSKLVTRSLTPNAALLKFQGSANLTVDQVLRRRSEFLTTHGLNVISVRAEPGLVAIAIARPSRRVLHVPDVWKSWNPECAHGNHELLIALKEEDSSPLFLSPRSNAPHTLIAGSTGSGKSVLMQNILLGIACTNTPEQARIVLIDPKLGVDYFAFDGLPHLEGGIIEDQATAIAKLGELVEEMDRRYAGWRFRLTIWCRRMRRVFFARTRRSRSGTPSSRCGFCRPTISPVR